MSRQRGLVWVFDLDNTLHNANPHIFPHINRAMTAYLQTHLNLDERDAHALRQHYWRKYGATIQGLMRHHATDPRHFLHHTHQFTDLGRMLLTQPGLSKMLKRLPGRKLVFSNSPAHYAKAVLKAMKIGHLFHNVFSIEHARYQPKPKPHGFLRLCSRTGARLQRCVMIDDMLENLKTAEKLGMKTIWVGTSLKAPSYVNMNIRSVMELPKLLGHINVRQSNGG